MSGELGRATYELDADLGPLRRNVKESERVVDDFERSLDGLTAIAGITEEALKQIKITAKQAGESDASADAIVSSIRGISDQSRDAAHELDRVRISESQATESTAAGERIKRNVNDIGDEADRTRRKLEEVRLAGLGAGGGGGFGRGGGFGSGGNTNPGSGVGPFGSGFGRIGALGTAIGAGILTTPSVGPAAAGLVGAAGVLGGGALLGGVGTLALAMSGVLKSIEGDKKAFQGLNPEAQKFVTTVRSLDGFVEKLKTEAAGGIFPGIEKGLHEALDPATIGVIERAISQLSHAIGGAGEEWGHYFGSPEFQRTFTTLMDEGARDIGLLSHSLLTLFDALGVVLRAGAPFTDWMLRAIDEASRLADQWLHQKERTGELAHAYDEAEVSLRLVVGLIGGLIHVVESLGSALYPVSKVAVKDLTDGLNALAQLIDRNKQAIRDIVGTALTGLKTGVEGAVAGVRLLNSLLEHFVGNKANVVTAILVIGTAIAATLGPEAAVILGVLLALGLIRNHWDELADYIRIAADKLTLAILEPFSHLPGALGEWARKAKDEVEAELSSSRDNLAAIGAANGTAYGQAMADAMAKSAAGNGPYKPGTHGTRQSTPNNPGGYQLVPDTLPNSHYTQQQVYKLLLANGLPKDVATNLAIISAKGEDSSGDPTRLNNNPSTGDYSVGLFQENFLGQMGVDRVRKYAPQFGKNPNMPVAAFVDWLGKHPSAQAQIAYQIFQAQGYGAWTTAAGLGISGGGTPDPTNPFSPPPPFDKNLGKKPTMPTGANLLTEALRNALQTAKDNAKTASSPSAAATWLHAELDDLEQAKKDLTGELKSSSGKKKAAIQAELRTIDGAIASVHQQITSNLKDQAKAIKEAFKQPLSTGRAGISSAVELVKASLNAQLQVQLQDLIDNVLGPRFFQGTDEHGVGRRTPLEKQLADMQAADTKTGLNDALTNAQKQLDLDRQTVDVTADQLAADQKAVDQAQRAIDENDLAIRATAERAQADHDYAEAVKQAQADTAEKQRQMDAQLDAVNKGLQNGTKSLDDLRNVAEQFGVSLTAGGGIADDFDTLSKAVRALALTLAKEAKSLLGVGDKKDAKAIQQIIDDLNTGNPTVPADGLSKILGSGAIPMAAGGIGTVTMPTLFLAGEHGQEDYAFSGGGRSFESSSKDGGDQHVAQVKSFANELDLAIWIGKQMQRANKRGVKFELV